MDRQALLDTIAPCGLSCGKCLANPQSPISYLSRGLLKELAGFGKMAERFSGFHPVFRQYQAFEAVLSHLGQGASCTGCRTGECLFQGCRVKECVRKQGVDYCFQCSAFPCEETGFPSELQKRWQLNNQRMAEIGLENYAGEIESKPRYGG